MADTTGVASSDLVVTIDLEDLADIVVARGQADAGCLVVAPDRLDTQGAVVGSAAWGTVDQSDVQGAVVGSASQGTVAMLTNMDISKNL